MPARRSAPASTVLGILARQRGSPMLRRLALLLAPLLALAGAQPVVAQPAPIAWEMATEYPATAIPGQGVSTFAALVQDRSGGRIRVTPSYDAAKGIKSAGMLDAVRDGRL